MTKKELLNLSLQDAWEMYCQDYNIDCFAASTERKIRWLEGFNYACLLLSRNN